MRRNEIKKISAILFCALSLSACSAKHIDSTLPDADSYFLPKDLPHKKVIIDTDAGADDCAAIILAAKSRNLDILGVTTLAGNVSLEQVDFPELTCISGNYELTSTGMGYNFMTNLSLTSVNMPKLVSGMKSDFSYCVNLKDTDFSSLSAVEDSMFRDCLCLK